MDISSWVNDSFELAKSGVYPGVVAGQPLTEEYLERNKNALERQIVLGGLRLAYVIENIFGNNTENRYFLQ
jgi:hypothetical protein